VGWPLSLIKGSDLGIEPLPINRTGELHQLGLLVDDLIETCPKQIAFTRRRPFDATTELQLAIRENPKNENCKLQGFCTPKSCNLQPASEPEIDSRSSLRRCSQATRYSFQQSIISAPVST
jgi:hypothetical protein